MNTEQRSKNIFTYIKTHSGETKRPDDGRSISQNVAHLNILVHDVTNLLYYEYWIFTYFIHSFVDSFIPKWFLDNINVSKDIESKEMETLARC